MLRSARQRANGHRSVHEDIDRIESFVRGGLDRKSMRGLAIFASSATDLWTVIELPVPVRSHLVINHAPAVGQLESVDRKRVVSGKRVSVRVATGDLRRIKKKNR